MSKMKITGLLCAVILVATLATHLGTGSTNASVRCTTWNLEWFPNGSAKDASTEEQDRRIADAANVLKPLHPDFCCFKKYVITLHVMG